MIESRENFINGLCYCLHHNDPRGRQHTWAWHKVMGHPMQRRNSHPNVSDIGMQNSLAAGVLLPPSKWHRKPTLFNSCMHFQTRVEQKLHIYYTGFKATVIITRGGKTILILLRTRRHFLHPIKWGRGLVYSWVLLWSKQLGSFPNMAHRVAATDTYTHTHMKGASNLTLILFQEFWQRKLHRPLQTIFQTAGKMKINLLHHHIAFWCHNHNWLTKF